MSGARDRVVIGGEVHVTLRAVADCYRVDVTWMEKVYELGLLGRGEQFDTGVVIAAAHFDRIARIIRLHFHHGVDLETLPMFLDPPEVRRQP